jgi:hypothetical protein
MVSVGIDVQSVTMMGRAARPARVMREVREVREVLQMVSRLCKAIISSMISEF